MLVHIDIAHCSVNRIQLHRLSNIRDDEKKYAIVVHFFLAHIQNSIPEILFPKIGKFVADMHVLVHCIVHSVNSMVWVWGMTHGNHFSLWFTFKFWTNLQLLYYTVHWKTSFFSCWKSEIIRPCLWECFFLEKKNEKSWTKFSMESFHELLQEKKSFDLT